MFCCFAPKDEPALSDLNLAAGNPEQETEPSTSGREADGTGRWQILWNRDRVAQRIVFEAGGAT